MDARRHRQLELAGLVLLFIGLWLIPIATRLTRAATVVVAVGLYAAAMRALWRVKPVRFAGLGIAAVIALFLVGPSRHRDATRLRARYVAALASYEGTTYRWGGENWLGIDCSGLVRRGLVDASLSEGLRKLDPGLVRASLELRWHDASARALKGGHRDATRPLFEANSIRAITDERLQAGDFAVTSDGVHTLAYLGGDVWIAADPGVGRVIKLRPADDNPWLDVPVVVMRWRMLEP